VQRYVEMMVSSARKVPVNAIGRFFYEFPCPGQS